MYLGLFWDCFGIGLAAFGDSFRMVLGPFWDVLFSGCFGIVLGSVWDGFRIVLGSFWDRSGIVPGFLSGQIGLPGSG